MRMGEYLLRKGILTKRQLDEALHAQLLYGGHLGTCLMELGHIDEFRLGEALAEICGVPYASTERFRDLRISVIKTTPVRFVEKYHAVPFEIAGNALRVAMIDPKNLPALDEIAFATGLRTEAWVAPEARILQAMERFYDIPRRHRYVHLCRRLDGEWMHRKPEQENRRPAAARATGASKDPGEVGIGGPRSRSTKQAAASAPRTEVVSAKVVGPAPASGSAVAAAVVDSAVMPGTENVAPFPAPGSPASEPNDDRVSDRLCRMETIEGVADVVLDEAARGMARGILFLVKSANAVICSARGLKLDRGRAASLSFPIAAEPVFSLFLGDGYYRGPLPDDPRYLPFYEKLAMPTPSELMVLPVHLEDRLVALFYGDDRRSRGIDGETVHYRMLMRKFALGLHLVIIKKKIRSF